jgi:hypothetical protein
MGWLRTHIALLLLVGLASPHTRLPGPQHVVVLVLENTNWSSLAGNLREDVFLNTVLLPQASYALRYYNPPDVHPSLPNYLWLQGGQCYTYCGSEAPPTQPITSSAHLTAQLDAAGLSWGAYLETAPPGICPTRDWARYYAVRHNPFVYFSDVVRDPAYCVAHIHPYSALPGAVTWGTLPRYVFLVPNLCGDGHSACPPYNDPLLQEDIWLRRQLAPLLHDMVVRDESTVFVTWDEGEGGDGPIGLLVFSAFAKGHGYHNAIPYTHSSLLRTVEELLGVPPLGAAAQANDLGDLFRTWPLAPVPRP